MSTNTNTITNIIPQLLAQGLVTLRENAIMPRLVNASYSAQAAEQGASIDIPVPAAISATDVTPSYADPNDTGITPDKVTLERGSVFYVRQRADGSHGRDNSDAGC